MEFGFGIWFSWIDFFCEFCRYGWFVEILGFWNDICFIGFVVLVWFLCGVDCFGYWVGVSVVEKW